MIRPETGGLPVHPSEYRKDCPEAWKRLAYYITPHGFGHAVRSLEVIRQLLVHKPRLQITVVSDIPEFLVEQRVGKSLPFRRRRLDVGLVQKDSVRFDLEATQEALQALFRNNDELD